MSVPVQFRLGKLPAQPARPHVEISTLLGEVEADPPPSCDWQSDSIVWPMYGNADWGDCVFAEIGHSINQLTFYAAGSEVQPTDADILGGYSDVTGFDPNAGPPGNNPTDQGTYVQDAMKYWRATGVGGHRIIAYASLDVSNLAEIKKAIAIFGSVSVGMNFPSSAMDQFNREQVWDVVRGARNAGGHCVLVGAYGSGRFGLVTWGSETEMTEAFWKKYVDEAWVVLDAEGLRKAGEYFTGSVSLYALGEQFAGLTGEDNPVAPPQPVPVPTPPPSPTPAPDSRLAEAAVLAQQLSKMMQPWVPGDNETGA